MSAITSQPQQVTVTQFPPAVQNKLNLLADEILKRLWDVFAKSLSAVADQNTYRNGTTSGTIVLYFKDENGVNRASYPRVPFIKQHINPQLEAEFDKIGKDEKKFWLLRNVFVLVCNKCNTMDKQPISPEIKFARSVVVETILAIEGIQNIVDSNLLKSICVAAANSVKM